MSELTSRPNKLLHILVTELVKKSFTLENEKEYHLTLLKAMNPASLSVADLNTLNDLNILYS